MDISQKILSDVAVYMKYAKYIPEFNRRETWEEIVYRNMIMHIDKFKHIDGMEDEIRDAYRLVYDKKILPSMRSLQFAGKPIDVNPTRLYNCAFLPIDDWRAFSEVMFLLLGGCFEETTEILTKDGVKQIKDVTTKDYVLTFDETDKQYHWVQPRFAGETPTANKQKIELTFENGKTIKCTADHKFLTKNRGWVEAKDLADDDDIECFDVNK